MPINLAAIGITSQQQADELERDLGVRFHDFTPEDCETWILQTVYLDQFSKTRVVSFAADAAGVTIRTARRWQAENTLGFNNRLEIAVLRYTDVIEVMLLQRAQAPDSPPSLLMMLLRAQMPEKYGSARRSSPPRDNTPSSHHCDHDHQPNATSQYDRELLEEIFRDLQNLKKFAGLSDPSNLSPAGGETQRGGIPTPTNQEPVGAGFKPAPDPAHDEEDATHPNLSPAGGKTQRGGAPTPTDQPPAPQHPAPTTQNLKPALNRRQRRELQRKARKRQKSHLARAPN